MASNEGYANLAAAVLNFFGSRHRARKQEQRERRKEEREDKRTAENRAFLKEMEGIRGTREENLRKEDIGLRREALDRAYPKKGFLDKLMETVGGVLNPSSQDRLARSQAGLFDAQAGLINRTPAGVRSTGMQMPGNPRMRRGGNGQGTQPRTELVEPDAFFKDAAKNIITGVASGFRRNGRQFDPKTIPWSNVLKMKRQQISDVAGRDLSDEELEIIRKIIEGGEDEEGNQVPGMASGFLTQTLPPRKKIRNVSGNAR